MVNYGKRYSRDLSTKQIAKLVRQEIAADVKAGKLPAGSYSVRIDETSMSASIDVRISDLAGEVFDRDFLLDAEAHFARQRKAGGAIFRHVAPVRAAVAHVNAMLAAYNFDDSGSLSNVNFFASVEVVADLNAARAALADAPSNVVPLFHAIKPVEEPSQLRFMREAGLL